MRHGPSHVLIAVLLVAFLLPLLYVASAGPAIWCRDRAIIPQRTLATVYSPVVMLYEVPVMRHYVHWYLSKWHNRELAQQNGQL